MLQSKQLTPESKSLLEMKRKTLQSCERLVPKKTGHGPSWQRNNDILSGAAIWVTSETSRKELGKLYFFCDNENDVPKIQVQVPIQEMSSSQTRIETREIVFQAQNDISHGVNTAIHSLRTNELGFESVSAEQSTQRLAGEVVEMSRRMDLTPFAASGAS